MNPKLTLFLLITMFNTAVGQISFAPAIHHPFIGNADHLVTGDFNNDGLQDVAVSTDYRAGTLNDFRFYVYLQSATTHTLIGPTMYSYGPNTKSASCMTSSDINNDGRDDIVIGYTNNITILTQDNAGGFSIMPTTINFGQTVNALKVGDVNNDGVNDIVVSFRQQTSLSIIFGDTAGSLSAPYPYPGMTSVGTNDIEITYLNGSPQKVIIKFHGNAWSIPLITLYYINANRTLDSLVHKTFVENNYYYSGAGIAVGDVYGNGIKTVILGKQWLTPSLAYWSNTTQTVLDTLLQVPANTGTLATGDLNCDGKDDIVMMKSGIGQVSITSNYTTYNYQTYCSNSTMPDAMALADVNGDGMLDIVSVNSNSALSVLINSHPPCAVTLPIQLLNFTAENKDNRVILEWTTATEINNEYFNIERSKDGISWESIGVISGCGTCSYNNSYTFSDQFPLEGVSYYRMKQTDYDGKFTYSELVVVDIKKKMNIQVWSDKSKGTIFISGLVSEATIEIYDTTGKLMVHLKSETKITEVPAQFFPRGCYLIKVYGKNETYSTKLIL